MVMVRPPYPLDEVKRLAVRVADAVQPSLVVEIHGVRNQCVSLPMSNRVAHPQGTETRIVRAAVRENLVADGVVFKKQNHFAGGLDNLHREWMKNHPWVAGWSTGVVNRVVRFREGIGTSSEGGLGCLILRLAPSGHQRFFLIKLIHPEPLHDRKRPCMVEHPD